MTLGMNSNSGIKLDPRTKLYILIIMNIIVISSRDFGALAFIKPVLSAVPLLLLMAERKNKAAVMYFIIYLISYMATIWFGHLTGILGMLLALFSGMSLRWVPCGMMGYYMIVSTGVNEFLVAMDRLKVPNKITIPFAVIFRFFPTVIEEYKSIKSAMQLRGVGFVSGSGNIVTILEYRMVPLIMSIVKIGNDLTAAAMTRGLSSDEKRSHICRIGFGIADVCLLVLTTATLFVYVFMI